MNLNQHIIGTAFVVLVFSGLLALGAQAAQDDTGDARLRQQLADVLGSAQNQSDGVASQPQLLSPEAKARFTSQLRNAHAEKREQVEQIDKLQREVNEQLAAQASPASGPGVGAGFADATGGGSGSAGGVCGMRFADMSTTQQSQCAAKIKSICDPKCAGYMQAAQNGSMRASYEGSACLTACYANNVPDDYPNLEQMKASAHANYDQAKKYGSNAPVFLNR
jgi:type II secretory pathway pseudopilin PulG